MMNAYIRYLSVLVGFVFCLSACSNEENGEYVPLPKLHLNESFTYRCGKENLVTLPYDTLGRAALLNFYKDEVTVLDYISYDDYSCAFTFRKGETSRYRISWEYDSGSAIRLLYGQNGMWYRMNRAKKGSYVLEANDGMTIRVVAHPASFYDTWLDLVMYDFRIEDLEAEESPEI